MKSVTWNGNKLFPSKIVCVGRNYVEHIRELNNRTADQAVLFIKPNSAICDEIQSQASEHIHYESELCFLVQQEQLAAVGFGLDLTKRQLQNQLKSQGLPWERAKAFNNSAVFSEFVDFQGDMLALGIELRINGEIKQQGGCRQMLYKPDYLLKEIAHNFSLEDGDIIMTGTPKGVGEIIRADVYCARVLFKDTVLLERNWQVQ